MKLSWSPAEFEHTIGIKGPSIPEFPDCCASCGDLAETTVVFKFLLVGNVHWRGVRDFRWSEKWDVPVCKSCQSKIDRARKLKGWNWTGWLICAAILYGIWPPFKLRIIPQICHKIWMFWLIFSHGPLPEVLRITPYSEDGSWIFQSNSQAFVAALAKNNPDRISSAVKNTVALASPGGGA